MKAVSLQHRRESPNKCFEPTRSEQRAAQTWPLTMGEVIRWRHDDGTLDLSVVQRLHEPNSQFRISPYAYPAFVEFSLAARAGRVYVLSGDCSYQRGDIVWSLEAPSYVDLPEGEFRFRAASDVQLIYVWPLPPELWGAKPNA